LSVRAISNDYFQLSLFGSYSVHQIFIDYLDFFWNLLNSVQVPCPRWDKTWIMLILLKFGKNSRNTIEVLSSLIAMNSATFEFLADFGLFFVLP